MPKERGILDPEVFQEVSAGVVAVAFEVDAPEKSAQIPIANGDVLSGLGEDAGSLVGYRYGGIALDGEAAQVDGDVAGLDRDRLTGADVFETLEGVVLPGLLDAVRQLRDSRAIR